ncbi:acyltransferase [Nocardioides dongxiaopingii]|uniref:acyltransferase family protein n=1 Tax=Nocardioides sp. S-1144 TaxID=2582905 RepID=UPI00110ECB67|nr:acyltransferase family protein [Nocardioides sp. S-1144]QCW50282.1 acyltransferase [Nocardioides sp. S-1144]
MSAEATGATRTTAAAPGSPPGSSGFRPDIQGIRALAVLLVVVNHLFPGRLAGGFIGVDVFFVVSGFLITSLLLKEGRREGRISLVDFYARRARRIIPAAAVVTLATVLVALLTLPLLRVKDILSDAVWATFFAANVRMARVGTDYFAEGQPPSPLRHYWSLAVEEQFYLVWPALLVLLLVVLRRRGDAGLDRRFRRAASVLIGVVILASLAWSVWATYESPVTAYFSSFTRAYELGAGAACALLPRLGILTRLARNLLGGAGLLLVVYTALTFTGSTAFPSWHAALPVLGTVALIVAGGSGQPGQETAVGRLLSLRPAVVIGDWSYSLYLWHWPVIVLLRSNLGGERFGTVPVQLATLALIFLLSWASYRWIENPFRRGTWRRTGRSLLIYPVSIATVVAAVLVSNQVVRYQLGEFDDNPAITVAEYAPDGAGDDEYVALVKASVAAAKDGAAVPSDLTPGLIDLRKQTASLGDCDYRTGTTKLCAIGDPDADRSIVMLGDSHARALSPAFEKIGAELGYRVYVLVYSGCSATSLTQIDRETDRAWEGCEDFKEFALGTIEDLQPDLTVIGTDVGRFTDPASGRTVGGDDPGYFEALDQGWRELFTTLLESSDRVAVVGNTPKLPTEVGTCLTDGDPDLGDCAFAPGPYSEKVAKASFAAAEAVGADRVNAKRWFCAEGLCPAVVGSFIAMRDSEHVTPDYARWLATPLAEALDLR